MIFVLHERLAADTVRLLSLPLCELLLMNDARYPWCILVPRVAGATEIIDLSVADQTQLQRESVALQHALRDLYRPDKLNVAMLGNVVPQLHVHHLARFRSDATWPAPVWGRGSALPYPAALREERASALRDAVRRRLYGTAR
jgi:diadenosine tetraphosphate (Ap4A) HIT family hydrolase